VTDVCTTFLALSLRAEGYSVFANIEGSGTTTQLIRDTANSRMEKAGVQLVSLFSIVCDLMRDWRVTPGAKEVLPYLDRYLPVYGMLARGHAAAIENGTVIPGEAGLITGQNGTVVIWELDWVLRVVYSELRFLRGEVLSTVVLTQRAVVAAEEWKVVW
jgi:hypothetical protein